MNKKYAYAPAFLFAINLGVANAQNSSISIYGIADSSLVNISNKNGYSVNQISSGRLQASRIGFMGVEDLGGGASAIFTLESGLDLDTGSNTVPSKFFNRQSWVGVKIKTFGSITLGRQYSPLYDQMVTASGPFVFGIAGGALDGIAIPGSSAGRFDNTINGTRVDNSIKFSSEEYNGFSAVALLGLGEVAGSTEKSRALSLSLRYSSDKSSYGLGYFSKNCDSQLSCSINNVKDEVFAFMGKYNFNPIQVNFIYSRQNNAKNIKSSDANVFSLIGIFPYKSWRFSSGYQYLDDRSQANQNIKQYNFSINYNLNKKVALYSILNQQKVSNNGIASMALTNSSNSKQRQISAGIRYIF